MMAWRRRRRAISLDSGAITFRVPMEEGEPVEWETDVTILQIIAEECERRNNLTQRQDGSLEATEGFLDDLARCLCVAGCPRHSPTLARQVWIAVAEAFAPIETDFRHKLKKALR